MTQWFLPKPLGEGRGVSSSAVAVQDSAISFQRLYNHRLVFFDELFGQFLLKIITGKGDTLMRLGNK